MYLVRKSLIVASAALMTVALPQAFGANTNSQTDQQKNGQSQNAQQNWRDEQAQNNQQSNQQNGQQQYGQQQNGNRLTGTVLAYREANIDGTQHFRVRLQTGPNQVESVDLGPTEQSRDLIDNIEQGDHISVQGQRQKMDGKTVFVAERARVNGTSYTIGQSRAQAGSNESSENQGQARNFQSRNEQSQDQQQKQPKAVVLLDERFVFLNQGDLNRHLITANEDLRMGDNQEAAGELRIAANRIEMYANSARHEGKAEQDLQSARQELDRLADQIEKGGATREQHQIDQAAARAQLAMAQFFDERIQNEKGRDRSLEAGYALQSAALHTREALMWSDEQVPPHVAHTIREALETADAAISGNQQQAGNLTQVAQNLDRQIEQIDQRVGENQAQPASERQPGERQGNRFDQQEQNQQGREQGQPQSQQEQRDQQQQRQESQPQQDRQQDQQQQQNNGRNTSASSDANGG